MTRPLPTFPWHPDDAELKQPPSWQARLVNQVLSYTARPLLARLAARSLGPDTMHLGRRGFALLGIVLRYAPASVTLVPAHFAHFNGEWVRSRHAVDDNKVLLYLHGGGYFFSSAECHRQITWRLSQVLKRQVLAINYRMAPRFDLSHSLEDALTAYRFLLDRGHAPEDILVAGDSAGGHLTLSLLQTLRDQGQPLPRAALCLSPWADTACTSDSMHHNSRLDPMFPANAVRQLGKFFEQHGDPFHPSRSPVYGEFHDLPPLFLMAGSTELLRDDARRVAYHARMAGVRVVHEEWHQMPHVFPILAFLLPEGRQAFRHMARFVRTMEQMTQSEEKHNTPETMQRCG